MRTRVCVVGVFALLVVAAGCPKTKGAESNGAEDAAGVGLDASVGLDGGPTDAATTTGDAAVGLDGSALDAAMAPDAGCSNGQVQDGLGVCRTTCTQQSQCAATEVCVAMAGLCLPRPAMCDPSSCPPGFMCPAPDAGLVDGGPGACVPQPGYCTQDRDCSLVDRCDNNHCISRVGDIVRTCGADAGCPLLMACTFGVCTGCIADLQCSVADPDARCLAGTCVSTGTLGPGAACIGRTCPTGERCNIANGQCEATCSQNSDCADAGEICAPVLNQCVTDFGCTEDGGCASGLTCAGAQLGQGTGVCVGCNDTTPCGPGLVCLVGACFPDLAATACTGVTCGTDESCDPQNGDCYPSNGTCANDTQCREGHNCNFLSLCSGCSVDADCRPAQRCFIGTCLPTGGN